MEQLRKYAFQLANKAEIIASRIATTEQEKLKNEITALAYYNIADEILEMTNPKPKGERPNGK